jgi:hydroxymethylpyrimidine pyrophosphatase-like HAD family hydrolase
MICDTKTGTTLHRFGVSLHIVKAATAFIHDAGHAAMVLKDRSEAGVDHDYLVVTGSGDHPVDPVSIWWFEEFKLTTRFVRTLDDDVHPHATVRVGLVADAHDAVPLMHRMKEDLGPEVMLHSFPALVADDQGKAEGREVHVLEVFDKRAHKWGAIEWVAQKQALLGTRVAAIGDHVNDLTMLRASTLGIAMGNAVPEAIAAANITTRRNIDDGVAHAIDQILNGVW